MRDFHAGAGVGGGGTRTPGSVPGRFRAVAVSVTALLAPGCGGDPDIEKPTPLFTESPVEYPLELWDQDVEGNTLVRVLVNEEGGVDSAVVVTSSGHLALDSAAVSGVLGMVFEPARKEGEPLRVWARVPVYFSKDAQPATVEPPQGPKSGKAARSPEGGPTGVPGLRG